VDLPHHGRSPWADHFDFVEIADQVAELFDRGDAVALVGHSLGGKVAMLLALRHPELVARLCVVDVSPVRYDNSSEFAGYIRAMQGLDLASVQRRGDADEALHEAVPNDTVRAFLLQNLRREGGSWRWQLNLEVLGEQLLELADWPEDRLTGVPPYDGPVLWLAGARSDYVREGYAPAMERWFPRTRRVTIKNAGHWLHSEQPEVFVEVLRRFLA
jgi:pimeloyl-ACP methyl ester carboxylesterase